MDQAYAQAIDAHLNTLAKHGCQVQRDGDQVRITTPDGHTYRSQDYPAAQGAEWGAIQQAMKSVGISATDVYNNPDTEPGSA